MRLTDVDGAVETFKCVGNDAFEPLMEFYKPVCHNWFNHLAKYMRIDREELQNDFQSLLFRSLIKFDAAVEGKSDDDVVSRFDRYFSAAIRKMSMGLKRSCMSQKRQSQKYTISLSDGKIDLPDARVEYTNEMLEVIDVIASVKDPVDRKLLLMRLGGRSRQDVCDHLGLPLHNYRARLARIQGTPSIVSLMTGL